MKCLTGNELVNSLSAFRNSKNPEIEEFLQEKAMLYESRRLCTTYIFADEDALKQQKLKVEGYFTLSHKILELNASLSNRKRKKLFHGFSDGGDAVPVILIGQLGKYIDTEHDVYGHVSGTELLDEAFAIINQVSEKIVCTCVMLECEDADNAKLHQFYQNYGFEALQKRGNYIQYIMFLKN